jgi:hypothetical protein
VRGLRTWGAALLLVALCGCPSEGDDACEDGEARCVGNDIIQFCDGALWGEEERCPPREIGGGQTILTYCYPSQGVCAP